MIAVVKSFCTVLRFKERFIEPVEILCLVNLQISKLSGKTFVSNATKT